MADDHRRRNARATGRPAPPPSTSTPTSPTRWSATWTPPATRTFDSGPGMELLVETARLWRSLGHHDAQGRFHIDGVTGPDEYSAIADDNVYTNLMAQQNLLAAADAAKRYPDRARELGVDVEESASWRDAAEAMFIPYDEALGVHPQAEGFTRHQVWDFADTPAGPLPAAAALPVLRPVPQAGRQAGRPGAGHALRGEAFTAEQKARNFDYYEPLTVRDSSLSACTQAVMAAEVGHLEPGLRLPGRGRPDGPARPGAQHPRRRAHRLAGGHLDRAGRRVRRACATGTARSASRRGCPTGSPGWRSASSSGAGG